MIQTQSMFFLREMEPRAGFEPATAALPRLPYSIDYRAIRPQFKLYLDSRSLSANYKRDLIAYLDRYVIQPISSPMDIIRIFANCNAGREHVWKGLRVLFNYLQAIGYPIAYLNGLRNALPKVEIGIDLKIPSESQIIKSLSQLQSAPLKYQALYNLLLDSGLRLIECIELINSFNPRDSERLDGFYRSIIGEFRGNKQAYYAYYSEQTFKRISNFKGSAEELLTRNASGYYYKHGYIAPKYLRKFAFDNMVRLEIPESIADFLEGRVAKRIGAKHYMALRRQADKFYKRYSDYIGDIRKRAIG